MGCREAPPPPTGGMHLCGSGGVTLPGSLARTLTHLTMGVLQLLLGRREYFYFH